MHKNGGEILFYENYVKYCKQIGKSKTEVAKQIGKSSKSVTGWKNGAIPRNDTQKKLADYFGISIEELMGTKKEPAGDGGLELDEKRMEAVKLLQKLDSEQVDAFITLLKSKSTEKD